jgi:hypothetical protein
MSSHTELPLPKPRHRKFDQIFENGQHRSPAIFFMERTVTQNNKGSKHEKTAQVCNPVTRPHDDRISQDTQHGRTKQENLESIREENIFSEETAALMTCYNG